MIKKIVKTDYICLFGPIIVAGFYLIFSIFRQVEPFGTNTFITNDGYTQIYPFLSVYRRKILNGENLLYFWNGGMGGSFLPIFFYYLAAPINLLVVLFPEDKITTFMTISIIIRVALASGTFAFYLKHKLNEYNPIFVIAASVAYALSGYICAYSYSVCWLEAYMMLPVILFGYKRMVTQRKPGVYVFSLAFTSFCNFYMAYILAIFLILCFFFDEHENLKQFIKDGIYFGIMSIIAALMTAVPIIVSVAGAVSSGNGEQKLSGLSHNWFGNIFELLRHQFFLSRPIDVSFYYNDANIYCGLIFIFLGILFFFRKDISVGQKIKKFIFLIILLLSMNESYLNFIWHGFHAQLGMPNRFSFLFIFMLLDMSYETYCKMEAVSLRYTIIGYVIVLLYPVLCYFFVNYDGYYDSHIILAVNLILIVIYGVFLIIHLKNIQIVTVIISLFIMTEVIVNSAIGYSHSLNNTRGNQLLIYKYREAKENEVKDGKLFFRSDIVYNLKNNGSILDNNSYDVFNTFLTSDFRWTLDRLSGFTAAVTIENNGLNSFLEDIYGLRYLYTYIEDNSYDGKFNCEKIYENDIVKAYENKDYLNLGYAVDKDVLGLEFSDSSMFDNINQLANSMSGCGELYKEKFFEYLITPYNCEAYLYDMDYLGIAFAESKADSSVDIEFEIDEDGQYYLFIDSNEPTTLETYINGKLDKINKSSYKYGTLFLGACLKGDKVKLEVKNPLYKNLRTDDEKYREYFILRVAKEDTEKLQIANGMLNANQLDIKTFKASSIQGTIDMPEDKALFLSIPYDIGWHIYEDGVEIPKVKIINSFLGAELSPGEHDIELRFIPQGLYSGIIISAVALLGFIVYLIIYGNYCKKD